MLKNKVLGIVSGIIGLILLVSGIYGASYASTPSHIRNPSIEHFHFRTQIINSGVAVDFSSSEFQSAYVPNLCTVGLSEEPFHFHDGKDQLTHVHWDGMTGGEFLKYFGWNFIGGENDNLGSRFDGGLFTSTPVNIYGNILPEIDENSEYFVYIGDEDNYQQKSWDDFLNSDLEEFFGVESNLSHANSSIWDKFFPRVYAHDGEENHDDSLNQAELTKLNNLIGNVVIFVQNDEPTTQQIEDRFNDLIPLTESTCGG